VVDYKEIDCWNEDLHLVEEKAAFLVECCSMVVSMDDTFISNCAISFTNKSNEKVEKNDKIDKLVNEPKEPNHFDHKP